MGFGRRRQEALRENQKTTRSFSFVGRTREIEGFINNFTLERDAPNKQPIIEVFGVGGVGKTRFLNHVASLLPPSTIISLIDETDQIISGDIVTLLTAICRNTRQSNKKVLFKKTSKLLGRRVELLRELQGLKSELPKSVAELIYSGARLAINSSPAAPIMDLIAPKDTVSEIATRLTNRLLQITTSKIDQQLLIDPKTLFTEAFVEDLSDISKGRLDAILLFDTYEVIGTVVNEWLLKYLIGFERDNIDFNLHLAIAGRSQPSLTDPRWFDWIREELVLSIELKPFTNYTGK